MSEDETRAMIVRLEEQVLYLQKDVSDLDQALRRQTEEIDASRREMEDLRARLLGVQQAMLSPDPETEDE